MHRILCASLFLIFAAEARGDEHVWLFAGQSNMAGGRGMYEAALRPVVEAAGHKFTPVHLAWGGNKIENWLDPKEKDYERNWGETEAAIQAAIKRDAVVAGVQWFQGESNVSRNACAYEEQLKALVAKLRNACDNAELPVLVVQLGPGTYAEKSGEWSLGILREAQRRFAADDRRVALVASTDCKLQDRVVHLSRTDDSHGIVARRLTDAAKKLVYGKPGQGLGPQVETARFGNRERTVVVVEFQDVSGELKLDPDALGQFFVSTKASLPERLSSALHPREYGKLADDHVPPEAFSVVGHDLALRFAKPLPESAVISWTATGHAALGRGRRWEVVFARLHDATGHQAPAFAALPIAPFAGQPVQVDGPTCLRSDSDGSRPVAVNLFLSPGGELGQDEVAGFGDWRQSNWNPTARFTFPYLFDDHGHVTEIAAYSYIHFGKRTDAKKRSADERLRLSGQTQAAEFHGLSPDTKYDIVLYLVAKGKEPRAWADLRVCHLKPPKKAGSKPVEVDLWKQQVFADVSEAGEYGWQLAREDNNWHGNVIVVSKVISGPLGVVRCLIQAPREAKAGVPNPALKPFICGMQIRKSQ